MIIRKRQGQGNNPSPTQGDSYPKIVIELLEGNHLDITASWPVDADVEPFAHLLAYLNEGKLVGPISAAVAIHAAKTQQREQGHLIHEVLQQSHRKGRERAAEDDDSPLIPPTQAVRVNMKVFHG